MTMCFCLCVFNVCFFCACLSCVFPLYLSTDLLCCDGMLHPKTAVMCAYTIFLLWLFFYGISKHTHVASVMVCAIVKS